MRRMIAAAALPGSRAFFAVCAFLVFGAAPCRAELTIEGALYYERGHYWIELAFRDAAGRDAIPADLSIARFEITRLGERPAAFQPSRAEALRDAAGGGIVVLTSAKLEGRACYRVTYRAEGMEPASVDSICDPFAPPPEAGECGGKTFFRNWIAPAFRRDGDPYRLNEFAYEYDFSGERPSGSFAIEPSFKLVGFSLAPSFEQRTVVYAVPRRGKTATSTRSAGVSLASAVWAGDLRLGLSVTHRYDRSTLQFASADSIVRSRSLSLEGTVRFDNLFDRINRHCLSVFKGVDLGFGCAWYRTGGGGDVGPLDRTAPFASIRATWTVLSGFQLSYLEQSSWPDDVSRGAVAFRSARFRLLLRDILEAQSGRAYHPDVELVYDWGTRLPDFVREEKLSIGFTFELYPW
jgi:hypothetical protein